MTRHTASSPEGQRLNAEIDQLANVGKERREACREARRQREQMEFPTDPTHEFYSQFNDPQRAYWNLPGLVKYYRDNPELPRPEAEVDHIPHAWDKAHENDQPAAFPLVWTPDGLQYDFSASPEAPVQPSLF